MNPLVSVVIPSYVHEDFLGKAIESVLTQTLDDLQLIIIDDCSHDSSWDIIGSFSDPRIRAFRHDVNRGAHKTLDHALSYATGKYASILNSDDLYAPNRLEKLVVAMDQSNAVLAFTDVNLIDQDGLPLPTDNPRASSYGKLSEWCRNNHPASWFLAGNLAMTTSNMFFRSSHLSILKSFEPLRYTHDWASLLRFAAAGSLCWLQEPLLSYRVHAKNTLNESDHWRHIHENAWIQVLTIDLLPQICQAQGLDLGNHERCMMLLNAWLRNASGPPLSTLLMLVLSRITDEEKGHSSRRVLQYINQYQSDWVLEEAASLSNTSKDLLQSTFELNNLVNTVKSQAELLDERYNAMDEMGNKIYQLEQTLNHQVFAQDARIATIQKEHEDSLELIKAGYSHRLSLTRKRHKRSVLARTLKYNSDMASMQARLQRLEADNEKLRTYISKTQNHIFFKLFRRLKSFLYFNRG